MIPACISEAITVSKLFLMKEENAWHAHPGSVRFGSLVTDHKLTMKQVGVVSFGQA